MHYITLRYITLHCIALHCIALRYITLHTYTYITYVYIYIFTYTYFSDISKPTWQTNPLAPCRTAKDHQDFRLRVSILFLAILPLDFCLGINILLVEHPHKSGQLTMASFSQVALTYNATQKTHEKTTRTNHGSEQVNICHRGQCLSLTSYRYST